MAVALHDVVLAGAGSICLQASVEPRGELGSGVSAQFLVCPASFSQKAPPSLQRWKRSPDAQCRICLLYTSPSPRD
eukprot:10192352-Alexandrium_andersonii.AAC.1